MCYTVQNIAYRTGVHDCIVVKCYQGYRDKHTVPGYYHGTVVFSILPPLPKNHGIFHMVCHGIFDMGCTDNNNHEHPLLGIERVQACTG